MACVQFPFSWLTFYKVYKMVTKATSSLILITNLAPNEPDYKLKRLECVADYSILENEEVIDTFSNCEFYIALY